MKGRKLYRVKLTEEERGRLEAVVSRGREAGWKRQRSQALLACDEGLLGPGWTDDRIVEAYGVSTRSLENWRKQAVEAGPLSLLERKPQTKPRTRKLDGAAEARLVALACSEAPEGRNRWTLRLLAERLVELEVVDSASHELVRQTLKQTR
jgi:hypothetical protein